jgi:hypothetical protein
VGGTANQSQVAIANQFMFHSLARSGRERADRCRQASFHQVNYACYRHLRKIATFGPKTEHPFRNFSTRHKRQRVVCRSGRSRSRLANIGSWL